MVCTGNICRSPAAELLLADELGPDTDVEVWSAGTRPVMHAPVSGPIAELLRAVGSDPSLHRAERLTVTDVLDADLVLGMTREHRSAAVALVPEALRRSFTLLDFAQLAAEVPPADLDATATAPTPAARLAALVDLAPRYRSTGEQSDIDDPYGQDRAVNARVFEQIREAITTIVRAITRQTHSPARPEQL